jgi:hypothetical protein
LTVIKYLKYFARPFLFAYRMTVLVRLSSKLANAAAMRHDYRGWIHTGPVSLWVHIADRQVTVIQCLITPHDVRMYATVLDAVQSLETEVVFVECTLEDSLPEDVKELLLKRHYTPVQGGFRRWLPYEA